MNISEPFIRRPVATTLLTIGVLLAGHLRLPEAAGGAAAAGGFPRHPGPGADGRRLPGDHGDHRGGAPGAPPRRHRRRHRDDLDEFARLGAHRAAVRPQPRHRRRGPRRPGGDQRRAGRPADGAAPEPDLPEVQPGRRADPDPGPDLRHPDAGPALRFRRHGGAAEAVPAPRRRQRRHRRLVAAGGAGRARSDRPVQLRHRPGGHPRGAGLGQRQFAQGRDRDRRRATTSSTPTTRAARRPITATSSWPTATAPPCASPMSASDRGFGRGPAQPRPRQRQAGRDPVHLQAARLQRRRDDQRREGRAPAGQGGAARRHRPHRHGRPQRHHPRLAGRDRGDAAHRGRPRHPRGVPVPALGPRHPDPGGGRADLHRRHLLGDVPARLQPRHPVADGADHRHRLRGRRRHRGAGEHPAPHRGRASRGSRRRCSARARSASPSSP